MSEIKDNITVRELCSEDEPLINEFFDNMGGESRALFNRRDYNRRGVLKFCARPDSTRRYFIATLEGKMAGYVFFLDYNTTVPELGIAVRDELRGQRLGMRLMEFAIAQARDDGKGGIQLTTHVANIRAQALYEKMGFVCKGICKNGTELFYLLRFSS